MYFHVCEHYNENKSAVFTIDDCFICFEHKTKSGELPIQLDQQTVYITNCHCNAWAHKECLDGWLLFQKKCPICRVKVQKIYVNIKNEIGNKIINIGINTFELFIFFDNARRAVYKLMVYYSIFMLAYLSMILIDKIKRETSASDYDDINFERQKYYNFTVPTNYIREE